jgi:ribosomal protein S12 methylthiotransferase
MNRKSTGEKIHERIQKLRSTIPDMVIRTSVIIGFPGETEEDFETLLEGVKKARFNHLGIFRYSDEEGTPAFKLNPKVSAEVIEERFDRLFEVQKEIARELNQKYIKQTIKVLVEGNHEDTDLLLQGRHQGQAPDIDGVVIINDLSGLNIKSGDMVLVEINDVLDYDLVGRVVGFCQ